MPAHLGYVALALLVGGESLGLLVPGETALLAAGVLARGGGLELGLLLPLAALAAIVGDNIGYLLGRRGGQVLLLGRGPLRDWRERALHRGERFFTRHGGPGRLPRALGGGRASDGAVAGGHESHALEHLRRLERARRSDLGHDGGARRLRLRGRCQAGVRLDRSGAADPARTARC